MNNKNLLKIFSTLFFVWSIIGIISSTYVYNVIFIKKPLIILIMSLSSIIIFCNTRLLKNKLLRLVILFYLYIMCQTLFFLYTHPLSCLYIILDSCWWAIFPPIFYVMTICVKSLDKFRIYFLSLLVCETFLFFLLYFLTVRDRMQSNLIYWPALLMPYIFFIKNIKIRDISMICIFCVILFSLKRSAFIYGFFSILLIIYDSWERNNNKLRTIFQIMVITTVSFIYLSLNEDTNNTIQRFENAVDTGDIRTKIYEIAWQNYLKKDIIFKIIGNGYQSTIFNKITQELGTLKTAHNDILEILHDYGIIGTFLYFMIIIYLLKSIVKIKKINHMLWLANIQALVTLFVMTMVSHLIIYPSYFAFITALWGINEGVIYINSKNVVI